MSQVATATNGPSQGVPDGHDSFTAMKRKGLEFGSGRSASFGWFRIEGLDLDNKRAETSRLVRTATTEEVNYAVSQTLEHTSCRATHWHDDMLLAVIRISPRQS